VVSTVNGGSAGYGSAQGAIAVNQLEQVLQYFLNADNNLPPSAVERGSQLNAYDPNDKNFIAQQTTISGYLSRLPAGSTYILPVVKIDPTATSANVVVGFARLRLAKNGVFLSAGKPTALIFTLGDSAPMRNATSATGIATVAPNVGLPMPASVAPFKPRVFDFTQNSLPVRLPGLVMAPALSPYHLTPPSPSS
jgi:hypothetical protein